MVKHWKACIFLDRITNLRKNTQTNVQKNRKTSIRKYYFRYLCNSNIPLVIDQWAKMQIVLKYASFSNAFEMTFHFYIVLLHCFEMLSIPETYRHLMVFRLIKKLHFLTACLWHIQTKCTHQGWVAQADFWYSYKTYWVL